MFKEFLFSKASFEGDNNDLEAGNPLNSLIIEQKYQVEMDIIKYYTFFNKFEMQKGIILAYMDFKNNEIRTNKFKVFTQNYIVYIKYTCIRNINFFQSFSFIVFRK